jgi:hypothetical protein
MPRISRRLKLLEKQLAGLDGDEAMLLTELDGFLAAGSQIGPWIPPVSAARARQGAWRVEPREPFI